MGAATSILLMGGCASYPKPDVAFDPATLRAGDVMLYAPDTWDDNAFDAFVGDAISALTHRLKSHVEVYRGNGMSLGARITGVNFYPVRVDATLACVRRHPNYTSFNVVTADAAVAPYIGKSYQVGGMFAFFNPWKQRAINTHVIRVCSPIAAIYERGGGCEWFNQFASCSTISPGDFFVTGVGDYVWRNSRIDRLRRPADAKIAGFAR